MCLKSVKSVSVIYWLIFLLLADSKSGAKPRIENSLCKELCFPKTYLSADTCRYYYSCTLLRELDESCSSKLSILFRPKVSDSFSELILASTSCKNGLTCQKSICKSKEVLESKRRLNSEFHRRLTRENVGEKETECDKTEENDDDIDYLHLEEDTIVIQDENNDYLGQPSRDQIDGIDDEDLENRMTELDRVQITFEPSATNSPVIFRPKKAALDDRSFDNVRRRGADKEAKYGSFKFDFEDKKLSQSAVPDIHLLTDATESLSGILVSTQLPEGQKNYQKVLIEEKNEFLDDDFQNVMCVQLNGIKYKLVYKRNMLDELNLLLSIVKMRSAEDHNGEDEYMSPERAKILYDLFKYYLEQKSLFQKLGMKFNFMNGPFLDNSESYVRKRRENENPGILNSEIKFAAPKSIQDVIKYIKIDKDDMSHKPRISELMKTLNENQHINSGNASKIESELSLESKAGGILKSDVQYESLKGNNSEDLRVNEWKNINEKGSGINLEKFDSNTENNNMTLKILKDFVNDSIAGFKDQLNRIEKQIGGVERKLEDVKMCGRERDLNGNIFISSSEKVPKIEETNDRNRTSKLNRVSRILNYEKLIQDILSRNNLKGRKRVNGTETGSTIPVAEASPRKGSFSEEVSSPNAFHQRKSLRPSSSNVFRYFGSNEELSRNEGSRRDQVTGNQGFLRNRELSKNEELSKDQDRWRSLQFKDRDDAKRAEQSLRFAKMVSDLSNWRHRRINYNPEESLFYLDNLKEVPRFIVPSRQFRKRDSQNQETLEASQDFTDRKKNISDPLSTTHSVSSSSRDNSQARWPIHSSATSWKMFIAKKDPDFSRRVQLQRTKSSPAGLIRPLNQEEMPGYRRKRREVNRMPSLPDYLDYPQGQGYATLGGNLSRDDQSRLLNDLTLNESHSPAVYQLDNRNNYSSGTEDNGEYLLSTFRSPLKENLEKGKTNLTTIQINERHLNQNSKKDTEDDNDPSERRKLFRNNSSLGSKRSRVWSSSGDHRNTFEEIRTSLVPQKGVSDLLFGFLRKEAPFNSKNNKIELNREDKGFRKEPSIESQEKGLISELEDSNKEEKDFEDKFQTFDFISRNEDFAHLYESDDAEEVFDFMGSRMQDSSILLDTMEYLEDPQIDFRKKRGTFQRRRQGLKL